jgi:long-chain acyl-CoA synthetase
VEKLSDADAEKMFRDADKDGDGSINFEEFTAMLIPTENKPFVSGHLVGEKKPGQTQLLRHANIAADQELVKDYKGLATLKDIFVKNAADMAERPFLGSRAKIIGENGAVTYGEYQWKTYKQVNEDARAFAGYLMKNELCPHVVNEEGTFRFVALYAKNREEWTTADIGSMLTATTVVTLYDTLGQESIDYILMQCQMKTVICSADKIKTLADLKASGKIATTTHVIHFDEAKKADVEAAQAAGITVVSFASAIE